MPTAFGPLAFSVAFHFSAMMSKASSQVIGREVAVLVVFAVAHAEQRLGQPVAAPYMIFERK